MASQVIVMLRRDETHGDWVPRGPPRGSRGVRGSGAGPDGGSDGPCEQRRPGHQGGWIDVSAIHRSTSSRVTDASACSPNRCGTR